jgi:hypothetical protein
LPIPQIAEALGKSSDSTAEIARDAVRSFQRNAPNELVVDTDLNPLGGISRSLSVLSDLVPQLSSDALHNLTIATRARCSIKQLF